MKKIFFSVILISLFWIPIPTIKIPNQYIEIIAFNIHLVIFTIIGFIMAKKYKYYSLILAVSVEVIQELLPYRSLNLLDLITNTTGIILGILLFYYVKKQNIKSTTPTLIHF